MKRKNKIHYNRTKLGVDKYQSQLTWVFESGKSVSDGQQYVLTPTDTKIRLR